MKLHQYIYFLSLLLIISVKPLSLSAQTTDKAKLMEFEDAITKGEAFLEAKDYAKAKAEYQKALSIDPSAKYPKDKLAQIRKVYIDPKDETDFQNAVLKGDQFIQAENYDAAKEQYSAALIIKPDNKPVKEKMAAAEKASIDKNTKLKDYNALVSEADKLYSGENYPAALDKYKLATAILPSEKHSLNRIQEIENHLAQEKATTDSYNTILNEGDEAYMNRDFANAKRKYEEASRIKPSETYPKSMLERISESMIKQASDQANIDKENTARYNAAIASGDKLLLEERFNEALQEYTSASSINPSEAYPKQKIELINKTLAQKEEAILAEAAAKKLAVEREQDSIRAAEAEAVQLAENRKQDSIKSALEAQESLNASIEAQRLAELKQEQERINLLNAQKLIEDRRQDSINADNEAKRIAMLNEEEKKLAQAETERRFKQQQEDERIALLNAQEQAEVQKRDSALLAQAAVEKIEQDRLAEIRRQEDEKAKQIEFEKLSLTEKGYREAIENGNTFYTLEDYSSAIRMFEKALN
jgi:tetratricopeptide (TPR) repeat protein